MGQAGRTVVETTTWVVDQIPPAGSRPALEELQLADQLRMIEQLHAALREERLDLEQRLTLVARGFSIGDALPLEGLSHPRGTVAITPDVTESVRLQAPRHLCHDAGQIDRLAARPYPAPHHVVDDPWLPVLARLWVHDGEV